MRYQLRRVGRGRGVVVVYPFRRGSVDDGLMTMVVLHLLIILFAVLCLCAAIAVAVQRRLPWRSKAEVLTGRRALAWSLFLAVLGVSCWMTVAAIGATMFP